MTWRRSPVRPYEEDEEEAEVEESRVEESRDAKKQEVDPELAGLHQMLKEEEEESREHNKEEEEEEEEEKEEEEEEEEEELTGLQKLIQKLTIHNAKKKAASATPARARAPSAAFGSTPILSSFDMTGVAELIKSGKARKIIMMAAGAYTRSLLSST
jgi:beta-phosphoglucomutase-like phosphatase (HAD superfamily)